MNTFTELAVRQSLAAKLAEKAVTEPTAVQREVIPVLARGASAVFRSETGTGKTFAFLLPLMTRILDEREAQAAQDVQPSPQPRIIIVAPTHELASQIRSEAEFLCGADKENEKIAMKTMLCIGGASIARQIDALKEKPQIVCGGPARLAELVHLKKLKAQAVSAVVLDETDRLLSPELRDATLGFLALMPKGAQLVACSATIKPNIVRILEEAHGAKLEQLLLPPEDVLRKNIAHWAFHAERRDKIDSLRSFLAAEKPARALVFSAETGQIANIVAKLQYRKVNCAGLHAKTEKVARKKAIDDFRSGRCPVLVTSDLAARGLDINGITHIIQMDLPSNEDFFVHRAGRTARAGKTGVNVVFGDEWELRKLSALEKKLGIVVYPKVLFKGAVRSPEDLGFLPQSDEGAVCNGASSGGSGGSSYGGGSSSSDSGSSYAAKARPPRRRDTHARAKQKRKRKTARNRTSKN